MQRKASMWHHKRTRGAKAVCKEKVERLKKKLWEPRGIECLLFLIFCPKMPKKVSEKESQ